jgi:anti-sigma B factor antagonist
MQGAAPSERSSGSSRSAVGNLDGLGLSSELTEGRDGVVVALRGELDLASAPELQRQLLALVERPVGALTLDLAGLEFLDSSGLGTLYRTRQAADEAGIALRLRSVPDHVLRVLDVTAMAPLFDLDPRSS